MWLMIATIYISEGRGFVSHVASSRAWYVQQGRGSLALNLTLLLLLRKRGAISRCNPVIKYCMAMYYFSLTCFHWCYYSSCTEGITNSLNLLVVNMFSWKSFLYEKKITQKSLKFTGVQIWNQLPKHLKDVPFFNKFKKLLKSSLS